MRMGVEHMQEQVEDRTTNRREWVSKCDEGDRPAVRYTTKHVNGEEEYSNLYIQGNKVSLKRALEIWKFLTYLLVNKGIIIVQDGVEIVRRFKQKE